MAVTEIELKQQVERAKQEYAQYVARQRVQGFRFPEVTISLDEEIGTDERPRIEAHMEVEYSGTRYQFSSVRTEHADMINRYLDSLLSVRAKYADGTVRTIVQTQARAKQLSDRFVLEPKDLNLHLFSGFIVTDAEEHKFLGISGIGGSSLQTNYSEMFFLNRSDSWSHPPEVVQEYEVEGSQKLSKQYRGVATSEVCSLLQYASYLKAKGHKIKGQELVAAEMTARIDNPGSWKAAAKADMLCTDVVPKFVHGTELRYQLLKYV
jgi:hypothetical protein